MTRAIFSQFLQLPIRMNMLEDKLNVLERSLNLIKIGGEMLRVTHYMYFDEVGEFAPLSRHIVARHGRPFTEGVLHTAD